MYIALAVMLVFMILGRLFGRLISANLIGKALMGSILLLLFLLGASIGGNGTLFSRLPDLGWNALVIVLFCIAGSIIFQCVFKPWTRLGKREK